MNRGESHSEPNKRELWYANHGKFIVNLFFLAFFIELEGGTIGAWNKNILLYSLLGPF